MTEVQDVMARMQQADFTVVLIPGLFQQFSVQIKDLYVQSFSREVDTEPITGWISS